MSTRIDAALALAARPFVTGVIALRQNSKHEHKTGHEFDRSHATKDADTLRGWWTEQPRAGVAYLLAPGFVVVDVDARNGGDVTDDPATYNESTASDGLHIVYRLPDDLAFAGTFEARPGVELHGAGQRITGPGTTINGKPYAVLHDPDVIATAPDWVIGSIEAHQAAQLAKAALRASSTATLPPTQPIDNERGRRWAEAGLLALAAELHEAPRGTRNDAIRRCAFKAGELSGYLPLDMIESHMLAACSHFYQQNKVVATVRKQIAAGALEPRHPTERDDKSGTRRALAAMVELLDSATWGGKMPFSYTNKKRERVEARIRGATVRAALAAILQQASKANAFDVRLSQRHVAEMTQAGKAGAWRVLQALRHASMLELIDSSNREVTGAEVQTFEGNVYRLSAAGFLALQRVEFGASACVLVESSSASMKGRDGAAVSPSLSCRPTVDSTNTQVETDAARHLGIFGHFQLGRSAYVIARALATHGALTAAQIVAATGLKRWGVNDSLKRMAAHGLVERGGRGESSALAPDFMANAMAVSEDMSTRARAGKRAERHIDERKKWRAAIEARKAEAQEAAQPDTATAVIEVAPKAAARAHARNAHAMNATRDRLTQSRAEMAADIATFEGGAVAIGAVAIGAVAIGAVAIGAVAIGAVAIGAVAIGAVVQPVQPAPLSPDAQVEALVRKLISLGARVTAKGERGWHVNVNNIRKGSPAYDEYCATMNQLGTYQKAMVIRVGRHVVEQSYTLIEAQL